MYIREAHPADSNWADKRVEVNDPKTQTERNHVATTCSSKLAMTLPMVVDDLQDTVNMAYNAWPERMYVITAGGKIVYKGGIGPWGFKTAETRAALVEALKD